MKKKTPQEASANAKFITTKMKVGEIADLTAKRADFVKQNPSYATQPAVQQATTAWTNAATTLNKCDQDIKAGRVALVALMATRQTALAAYKRSTTAMLTTIDSASGGSSEMIKGWGFDVVARATAPLTTDAPTGVRVSYTKTLVLNVHWKAVPGQRGYQLQIGDGTPAGWGPIINVPKSRFTPENLLPGQHIVIRVAVQRKNGLSAWSDSLAVTVR